MSLPIYCYNKKNTNAMQCAGMLEVVHYRLVIKQRHELLFMFLILVYTFLATYIIHISRKPLHILYMFPISIIRGNFNYTHAFNIHVPYKYYTWTIYDMPHIWQLKVYFANNVQDISPYLKVHTTRITVVPTCLINVVILTLSSGLGMG